MRQIVGATLWSLLVLSLAVPDVFAVPLSQREGDRLERKLDELRLNGAAVPVRAKKTTVSELEVNSYLTFNAKEKLPQGLSHPRITLSGAGAVAGQVQVNLDEFKRYRGSQGLMDPLSYLSGNVPVTARGIFRTRNGKGQFYLGSAEIFGIRLPKPIVQELVAFFSRTRDNPNGFDIDAPFDLPVKIREVVTAKGAVVMVQ